MDPSDPEYQDILDLLNEAVDAGTINDSDFADAGLTQYNGVWMSNQAAQDAAALDAQNLLTSGGNWASLTAQQQAAYANSFPQDAVLKGGASALNLMNPSILTPSLVSGYYNIAGSWTSPTLESQAMGPHYDIRQYIFPNTGPMTTPTPTQYVYLQSTNLLSPASYVGTLNTVQTISTNIYSGEVSTNYFYAGSITNLPGVNIKYDDWNPNKVDHIYAQNAYRLIMATTPPTGTTQP
jgi:hypothetical protein